MRRFHGMGGVGDLFGLREDATNFAIMGASAAGGTIVGGIVKSKVLTRLPSGAVQDYGGPVLLAALGVGAGMALQRVNRLVGAGFAAGMIGSAVAGLVMRFVPQLQGADALFGLGQDRLTQRLLEGAVGEMDTEERARLEGSDFSVEERTPAEPPSDRVPVAVYIQ